jgi:hypothetical protein
MKQSGGVAIGLAGVLLLTANARAVTTDAKGNPYQGIVERNVFALKPAPPPEANLPPPPPPPPIELQGITEISGRLSAMFSVSEVPPGSKPGTPAQKISKVLGLGQRDGDIEVVAIDPKARTVTFNNHGQEDIQDLNKAKLPASPVPPVAFPGINRPAVPGVPPPPVNPAFAPPANLNVPAPGSAGASLRSIPIPNRTIPGPSAMIGGARPTPFAAGSPGGIPTPAGVTANPAAQPAQPPPLTPEEQIAVWAIQKAADKDLPPMPPDVQNLVPAHDK